MFGETRRVLGMLAGATGMTLVLGVGVGTGLVPKPGGSETATSETAARVVQAAAADIVPATVPETAVPTVAPTTGPPTTVARRIAPTTRAPAPKAAAAAAATEAAPAPPAPPALATRTVPTAAQVQQVIAGIRQRVQLPKFFQITPAHVADIGNQICTAFDQGQTFAQVKATGLATVSRYVTVSAEAADYAVRQGVALYCPAYSSKLV